MIRASGSYDGLTVKQAELLSFLRSRRENTPTLAEMTEWLGLASRSGTHRLLTALEERGYIKRIHGRARAIEVFDSRQPVAECVTSFNIHLVPTNVLLAEVRRRMPQVVSR